MVSTDPDLNHEFGGGGVGSSGVRTLNAVKKIGATGAIVWAVLVFFAAGLCFILVFKCAGRLKRRFGIGSGAEGGDQQQGSNDDDGLERAREDLRRASLLYRNRGQFDSLNGLGKKTTDL